MKLLPEVFKAYDVRGLYPQEFNAQGAGRVAQATVHLLREESVLKPRVVLGRDARLSSGPIAKAVRDALLQSGAHILDIGLCTTPLYYFSINHLDADGGIMVTASHNPTEFNGLKLCRKQALAIAEGMGMERVRELALGRTKFQKAQGAHESVDVLSSYLSVLVAQCALQRPLSVAIDAGNGMAGLVLERLLPQIPELSVHRLYFEMDGTFPNHPANPLKEETLVDLQAALREGEFDCGIAFDADVDRLGLITPEGDVVRGDLITALLAKQALRSAEPGAAVLYESRSSRVVAETVLALGGNPILVRSGHAMINRAMREHNAVIGGELSGHFFFREIAGRDDAIFAMIRVLNLISESDSLSSLLIPLQKYAQSGERNFSIADKQGVLKRMEQTFPDGNVTRIDGLTVSYKDWWFNLRPSHTEDFLRLNVEADTQEILKEKLDMLERLIQEN